MTAEQGLYAAVFCLGFGVGVLAATLFLSWEG